MTPKNHPYKLIPAQQHYLWGTKNDRAFIPKLLGITAEPDLPYAELWMGAHPGAPAMIETGETRIPLNHWIESYPEQLLGAEVAKRFKGRIPFLFKLLSAGEPLSIQAHPDKAQAEKLYIEDPEHYPDANHKPEIAIALDHLTALVGLKTGDNLMQTLRQYPEITGFWGAEQANRIFQAQGKDTAQLQKAYAGLILKSAGHPVDLKRALQSLTDRVEKMETRTKEETLFLEMERKYGNSDIGLFFIFLLNRVELDAGQAVFLPAGVPHAYLKGNIIECMANSDNVVRVGLTPKFKDAETLAKTLTVAEKPHPFFNPASEGATTYDPPVSEFKVIRHNLKKEETITVHPESIEILLLTQGSIESMTPDQRDPAIFTKGDSILIPGFTESYTLLAQKGTQLFRALVPG